jgi:hypothetical protein
LVTFDLDFGAIYRQRDQGSFGAILLRLKDQIVESANRTLGQFFAEHPTEPDLEGLLVVIDPSKFRIIRKP